MASQCQIFGQQEFDPILFKDNHLSKLRQLFPKQGNKGV
jgi:hypothetical protein